MWVFGPSSLFVMLGNLCCVVLPFSEVVSPGLILVLMDSKSIQMI